MVNIRTFTEYRCGKCNSVHGSANAAEDCCAPKIIDWSKAKEFELRQEHLDLLKETWIDWDDCEFGAPCIDPKRPYGNSDVYTDVAQIIKMSKANFDEDDGWSESAKDYMLDLHNQILIAVQILLHCHPAKLGRYKRIDYQEWEYLGD